MKYSTFVPLFIFNKSKIKHREHRPMITVLIQKMRIRPYNNGETLPLAIPLADTKKKWTKWYGGKLIAPQMVIGCRLKQQMLYFLIHCNSKK